MHPCYQYLVDFLWISFRGIGQIISAGETNSIVICTDSTISSYGSPLGNGDSGRSNLAHIQTPNAIKWVDAGRGGACFAVKSGGSLWGWGGNFTGQVGDSTTIATRWTPVQVHGAGSISAFTGCQPRAEPGIHWHLKTIVPFGHGGATPQEPLEITVGIIR